MGKKIIAFFDQFKSKKTNTTAQEIAVANMLVDHMQSASNRPTAIIKNGNRGY